MQAELDLTISAATRKERACKPDIAYGKLESLIYSSIKHGILWKHDQLGRSTTSHSDYVAATFHVLPWRKMSSIFGINMQSYLSFSKEIWFSLKMVGVRCTHSQNILFRQTPLN